MADPAPLAANVEETLQRLRAAASDKVRDEMGPRYGIHTAKAMGVPMARMQAIARPLRPDHALAEALWATGWYEARTVAALIDDPAQVTPEQMDRWRADFDNWAIVDTVCFKLFDQTPHAHARIGQWTALNDEFGKRAGFALLACTALHGHGEEADFLRGLALIEQHATDDRNFVKKAANWALRAIGGKKAPRLRAEARTVAERLAASPDKAARWTGRDALRAFAKADGGAKAG